MITVESVLDAQQQAHSSNDPLGWLLFGFQIEGPHIGRSTDASFIHWALVYVFGVLFINWNSLDKYDWHTGSKLL